jgi:hypothetical protein
VPRELMRAPVLPFLVLASLAIAGCGSPTAVTGEAATPTEVNLKKIGAAYIRACQQLDRPPANLNELTPILKQQGNASDILRSPNDNLDFVIVWNVELRKLKVTGGNLPVIAFEQAGSDGKRHVLRGANDVVQLSEASLKSAVLPSGYKFPF